MHVLDVVGLVVFALCVVLVCLVVRRWWLQRGGRCLDVSMRLARDGDERWWAPGLGRYDGDVLLWYPTFSFALRPRRTVSRVGLSVRSRRRTTRAESRGVVPDSVVLVCDSREGPVEVALPEQAAAGFLAWAESAPPSASLRQVG